ncbi:N-acetylmuramoyl-L-alanine amidase [Chondromyces crocatus]|uniref:N-acetylmuramoyl-L-alanine amidase n=1 Tax=Chondromyces crocatus TaxID=52 RepID=A0A0K1EPI7_CHOCO|nr:N-acetylmuramoyl-L-alanine amidase [Chondromyces crocatus]AKT42835.1 N-acetylmuramoyl-L-alanine amidase [Chondromyces crocatus]
MHQLRKLTTVVSAAILVAACSDQGSNDLGINPGGDDSNVSPPTWTVPAPTDGTSVPQTSLDLLFEQAAKEFNVPASLLKAIGFAETRWEMVEGEEEFEGMPAAFGIMALRGERIELGAELAGVSVEEVKTDALANIRAAAALLSEDADGMQLDRVDLGAWAPVVAAASGIDDAEAQASYLHNEVYRTLRDGLVMEGEEGLIGSLLPSTFELRSIAAPPTNATSDHSSAIWRASPNFNSRSGVKPRMIIIHSCEGAYSGCWGWLRNSASGVSAHYVVNDSGSEITQLVREADRAWHIGAAYRCNLNGNQECNLNGTSSNNFTVGIEHAGFASQSSWAAGLINASAKLSCGITQRHGIPRDSYHIVSHGRLQPESRTDPGPNWPWTNYLSRINTECGGGTTPTPTGIIVDSNNSNNNSAQGRIEVSANWTSSTNVAGYYGSGYYAASTQSVSDGATFHFYVASAGSRAVSAWWTAASDRSTAAPFIMYNAAGTEVGRVTRNQQTQGGQWVSLGSYNFTAGWNKVVLSRWAALGSFVIADAVRIQ